ncbi:PmoA family protein [Aurantibacter sp.]|uniref:DUF6807 domain-containing protein n=1 Tax=Aurantibacter sp. TaxID=2807103 RepID=UPI003267EF79
MRTILTVLTLILLISACKEKKAEVDVKDEETTINITLDNNETDKKVDVFVGGKLFTSYLYADDISVLKKTTLYPIIAANGEAITRGYPLNTRPNERTDHPHHIGAWFNYGDVNGLDFWGNSDEIKTPKEKLGTIRHDKIVSQKNGDESSTLVVSTNWLNPDNSILMKEETMFVFSAEEGKRIIDRNTTFKALDKTVLFNDTKEGMFAIRTARELEHPSDGPVTLSDANGNKTDVPVTDNTGVSGQYLSSEGLTGTDVWGTRAKWMALTGTINKKDVTVVIMDQPKNVGYPTYWHARGYGLFAANPLGPKAFTDGKEPPINFTLEPNTEVSFSYRIAVLDGIKDSTELETEFKKFTSK